MGEVENYRFKNFPVLVSLAFPGMQFSIDPDSVTTGFFGAQQSFIRRLQNIIRFAQIFIAFSHSDADCDLHFLSGSGSIFQVFWFFHGAFGTTDDK